MVLGASSSSSKYGWHGSIVDSIDVESLGEQAVVEILEVFGNKQLLAEAESFRRVWARTPTTAISTIRSRVTKNSLEVCRRKAMVAVGLRVLWCRFQSKPEQVLGCSGSPLPSLPSQPTSKHWDLGKLWTQSWAPWLVVLKISLYIASAMATLSFNWWVFRTFCFHHSTTVAS